MAETLPPEPVHGVERTRSHRLSILHKFRHKKNNSRSIEETSRPSMSHPTLPDPIAGSLSRCPSMNGVRRSVSCTIIAEEYSHLHDAIVSHVCKYYSARFNHGGSSQAVIEHASTGMMTPWPQIRSLLSEPATTLATLSLCITWTILSRSLLLKLGISNSPGSSFLPPELVECFQSFSLGRGAVTFEAVEANSVNLALLSRWKQISATLLHSAYISEAFTHFDSRTVNIERALKDLDPLLSTCAIPHHHTHTETSRVDDLRDVLKLGAKFAFTLFSQPSFWKFDWTSDRAIEHGKEESQLNLGRVPSFDTAVRMAANAGRRGSGTNLTKTEIVIWPRLVRVMDGDGMNVGNGEQREERDLFGPKRYLNDFGKG